MQKFVFFDFHDVLLFSNKDDIIFKMHERL